MNPDIQSMNRGGRTPMRTLLAVAAAGTDRVRHTRSRDAAEWTFVLIPFLKVSVSLDAIGHPLRRTFTPRKFV